MGTAVRQATDVVWAAVSVWGWTMTVIAVVLAVAVLVLVVVAIRYLSARMRVVGQAAPGAADATSTLATGSRPVVQRAPTPVPPEDPHAPPTAPGGLTRPGY
ncbi:MAG: hypothetical protein JWM23_610 [Microbacteriaceae bacterium]|jgi:hypothetical protein|nr:hypothetical protein [Microbacteriaceae bacterium]